MTIPMRRIAIVRARFRIAAALVGALDRTQPPNCRLTFANALVCPRLLANQVPRQVHILGLFHDELRLGWICSLALDARNPADVVCVLPTNTLVGVRADSICLVHRGIAKARQLHCAYGRRIAVLVANLPDAVKLPIGKPDCYIDSVQNV